MWELPGGDAERGGSGLGGSLGAKLGWKREPKTGQARPRQSKISQVKLSVKSTVNYKEKCSLRGQSNEANK